VPVTVEESSNFGKASWADGISTCLYGTSMISSVSNCGAIIWMRSPNPWPAVSASDDWPDGDTCQVRPVA
jgi:hypothetical protein